MKRYWAYFKVVCAHRFWAFVYCAKLGIPWLGIIHDISKLYPSEFIPYAFNFFNADGSERQVRDATGQYNPASQSIKFQYAWLHHQRNLHHWQAWVVIGNNGELSPLSIPRKYCVEMVADWMAAGKIYDGKVQPNVWYEKNKDKLLLHEDSRSLIEFLLSSY